VAHSVDVPIMEDIAAVAEVHRVVPPVMVMAKRTVTMKAVNVVVDVADSVHVVHSADGEDSVADFVVVDEAAVVHVEDVDQDPKARTWNKAITNTTIKRRTSAAVAKSPVVDVAVEVAVVQDVEDAVLAMEMHRHRPAITKAMGAKEIRSPSPRSEQLRHCTFITTLPSPSIFIQIFDAIEEDNLPYTVGLHMASLWSSILFNNIPLFVILRWNVQF